MAKTRALICRDYMPKHEKKKRSCMNCKKLKYGFRFGAKKVGE